MKDQEIFEVIGPQVMSYEDIFSWANETVFEMTHGGNDSCIAEFVFANANKLLSSRA